MNTPNPRPALRHVDPAAVDRYRRIDCTSILVCLGVAHREGWHGLSCRRCDAYSPPPELATVQRAIDPRQA